MDFLEQLKVRLNQPLPGRGAQASMSPQPVNPARLGQSMEAYADYRRGAVMIVLMPNENGLFFPIIKRSTYDGVHSGQMGLPGGKIEESDQSPLHAAIRETQEEIGVEVAEEMVLGPLSWLPIPPSRFIIQPYVAYLPERKNLIADPREVQQIYEAPLVDLINDSKVKQKKIVASTGKNLVAPYFEIANQMVWGATAMVLGEFRQILKELD